MRRKLAGIGVAFAIVALASGVTLAGAGSKAIPNDGIFYACYDSGGNVKLIDYTVTQTCPKFWMGPVSWTETGLKDIGNVMFDPSHLIPGTPTVRAFVPTGSLSQACLVTFSESSYVVPGGAIYCVPRHLFDSDGVEVIIVYPDRYPWPQDVPAFAQWVTIHQAGAQFFDEPIYVPE